MADLFAACSLDRIGEVTIRQEDLRLRWLEVDDATDLLILQPNGGGPVVGYAEFHEQADPWSDDLDLYFEGRVHPAWTGRGIATFLLDRSVDRARRAAVAASRDVVALRSTVVDGDDLARAFFAGRGFRPVRHLLEMRLALAAPPPRPAWPDGVGWRTLRPGADEETAWRVHREAFADVATSHPLDLDTWLESRFRRDPAFDPSLTFLALHGDDPVGLAICRAGADAAPEDGWIRDLGVVPAWRRRGVGMALLRQALSAFHARGLTGAALEVDDTTLEGPVRLYERAGLRVVRRTDVVELTVAGVTSGASG